MSELLNHQVHIAILLAAPALLAISATAPLLLHLLFSEEFARASLLLRLQVTADALRLPGWALGFVLLARRKTLAYVLVEAALAAVFVPLAWWTVPRWGIAGAGAAYLIGYAISLLVAGAFARREGIGLGTSNTLLLACLTAGLMLIAALSTYSAAAAFLAGVVGFAAACLHSIRELDRLGINLGWAAARLSAVRRNSGEP